MEHVPNAYRIEIGGYSHTFPRDDLETAALLLLEHGNPQAAGKMLRSQYDWDHQRAMRTALAANQWLNAHGER